MQEYDYIKNAFTKDENNTNVAVNNLNVECITSKNNKFSLDSEGNLNVKTITVEEGFGNSAEIDVLNKFYPIGSIYLSLNATHPATLFGGTWEQIAKGRTLIGVNQDDPDFNESRKAGGEKTHTLTEGELPLLSGACGIHGGENGSTFWAPSGVFKNSSVKEGAFSTFNELTKHNFASSMVNLNFIFGNDQPHNNLPPYLTCYIWTRTA